jgi:ubiquinone biosynthesis monooxygenase Coq7
MPNPAQPASARQLSALDRLVSRVDSALRTLAGTHSEPLRSNPAAELPIPELSEPQRRHVAGLMRVNHAGEICAQALYAGQAATARLPRVQRAMQLAAKEEEDHLAWCEQRLQELHSHTSVLNPLWYSMSFSIGALAGIAGDRWSLGFVEETEMQVCAHLKLHLSELPETDERSKRILTQMHDDEAKHAAMAARAGAATLPEPVTKAMKIVASVMTRTAYHL